jgi:hypothetical protein
VSNSCRPKERGGWGGYKNEVLISESFFLLLYILDKIYR